MIGQTLGHYRILEKVGVGGMGEVYRAHDERLDRDVALKVLPVGLLKDERARRHFRQEALLLAKLNHPNIATIHEFDTHAGTDFVVMECVEGTSLARVLQTGPMAEKELLKLASQIAQALEEAHELGIVHRDLKPGNILITPKGRAKVLDFGIARLLRVADDDESTQSATASRGVIGTLPYMSPEQLLGKSVDVRSDIFSFGAVLYEMSTGRRTCEERVPSRLIDAILRDSPVPPRSLNPQISAGLERIILKCLEKDPRNRYQSAKDLEGDLGRLQAQTSAPIPLAAAPPLKNSRRRNITIVAAFALIAVLALGFGLWLWRSRRAPLLASHSVQSLAVLPLENLSGDPRQEYFAEGMTEELTTQMAQISALRVISPTSVTRYAQSHQSASEIAAQLHVDAVVKGSVMSSGGRVRITAQLIQASTDKLLWAQAYDGSLADVLGLQEEVARAIAGEVKVSLTPDEQTRLGSARAVNPAAHEAYLEGSYLNKGTSEQQRKAREYFEQAIGIDPNYAPAYAGLAGYYWSRTDVPPGVSMPDARRYALKALDLDPALADAHVELALIHFYADWDWPAAEKEFKRALGLSPSDAEAHRTYSYFLAAMGRDTEALDESRHAQQLDPLSIWTQITAGYVFYFTRHDDEAIAQCHNALEIDPNSAGAYDCLGSSYLAVAKYGPAIEAALKASQLSSDDPSRLVGLGRAYALAGKKSDALNVLAQLDRLSHSTYVPPYFFASIYAALGQRNDAFSWLNRAFNQRDSYLAWLKVDSAVDPLRSDPRFVSLLREVGFTSD